MTSETRVWLTPKEASAFTGLGISTLAKLRMTGEGPPFSRPLDNAVRYSVRALDEWMESKRAPQATKKAPGNRGLF